ncbi:MAG: CHASE2 domain-containing protein, partial [Rickettsiales bacterium]
MLWRCIKWLFSFRWIISHGFIGTTMVLAACYFYISAQYPHTLSHRFITPVQHWTFDTYQRMYPRESKAEDMPVRPVIIDIDEDALDAYGQWPWPRTVVAQMVRNLQDYGVLVIGFDIVFAEPDRTSPKQLKGIMPNMPDNLKIALDRMPDHDDVLAQAIARGRVVMGQVGELKPVPQERLKPKTRFGEKKMSMSAPSLKDMLHR